MASYNFGIMNQLAISGLLICVTSLFSSAIVLIKGPKRNTSFTWSLFSLSVASWGFGLFRGFATNIESIVLFWGRYLNLSAIFIPIFFFHFVLCFTNKILEKRKEMLFYYIGFLTYFLLVIAFPKTFVPSLRSILTFKYYPEPGTLYFAFPLIFAYLVVYGIFLLIKDLNSSSGIKKNQIKYLLFGVIVGFVGGSTTFFPVLGIKIYPLGTYLVPVYVLTVTYAIIRYRLMDITIAIKKTTLLACGVLLPIAGVVIGINFLQPYLTKIMGESWWLAPSGITVILTLALFKFVNYVIRLKDEELSRNIKHYRDQLRIHTEQLAKSKTIRELVSYTVRHISTIARLDFCAIALKKEEVTEDEIKKKRRFYIIEGVSDRTGRHLSRLKGERIEENSNLITHLKATRNPLEKGYLQYLLTQSSSLPQKDLLFEITQKMEEWNIELIFPAFSSDELVGLLFLGRKIDGAIYSKEDLELFSLLANQSAKPISEIIQREENIRIILVTAHSCLNTLEAKDHYTRSHTERVKNYCLKIASDEIIRTRLEKIPDGVWGLEMAAELHDLGKIGIPDNILNKPAKLTPGEFDLVKEHPKRALNMLGELSAWLKEDIVLGILEHQEHYDGTGYPKGLKGDNIHLYARIIHIADAYDAMTSERPYRQAFSSEAAVEEIKRNSGNQFDPLISGVFIKLYQEGKI